MYKESFEQAIEYTYGLHSILFCSINPYVYMLLEKTQAHNNKRMETTSEQEETSNKYC